MALYWLGPVRFENKVPPGQIETKIAISFLNIYGVVNAVHIWRDQNPTK